MSLAESRLVQQLSGLLAGACLLTLVMLAVGGWSPDPAAGAADKRTCGVMPGDGAYSYVKTKNVSCRIARKVSNKAGRNFCGSRYQDCNRPPGGGYDRGRVEAKGWRCQMKVGWEFYKTECERRNMSFVAKSAA